MVVSSTSFRSILGFAKYINVDAEKKGWAMSPVHKSVKDNAPRRTWNDVLTIVFFHIAAKIKAFPVTATGDKTAIETAIGNVTTVLGICGGEDVALKDISQIR